jgi:hypothetical protein
MAVQVGVHDAMRWRCRRIIVARSCKRGRASPALAGAVTASARIAAMRLRLAFAVTFAFALVVAPTAFLASCADYLDARAEGALREALARVVGPAASYDVSVSGASVDATRFERVRFVGTRIVRERAPVLDRLELELRGVVIDRQEKRLTALAGARGVLRIRAADLADHLRDRGWFEDARVVVAAPDRITISGVPKIGGAVIQLRDGAELQGRLVAQGAQLRLAVDAVRISDLQAPPLVRALLERAVNPLLDAGGFPVAARIDGVAVDGDAVVITASGSRLGSGPVTP